MVKKQVLVENYKIVLKGTQPCRSGFLCL